MFLGKLGHHHSTNSLRLRSIRIFYEQSITYFQRLFVCAKITCSELFITIITNRFSIHMLARLFPTIQAVLSSVPIPQGSRPCSPNPNHTIRHNIYFQAQSSHTHARPHYSGCISSAFGMSKISANSGGRTTRSQFWRNHSKLATCIMPSDRSSTIFASNAGSICSALLPTSVDRVRMICTRNASAIRSRHTTKWPWLKLSLIWLLRSVSRINAENRPVSMSDKPNAFRPRAKLQNAVANAACRFGEILFKIRENVVYRRKIIPSSH